MMNPRRAIFAVTCGCLMSMSASTQTQPTCPKGFQPYANRCISQRMTDYISCVEASGGNSERIAFEVQNADAGKTDVGVKGSGSGVIAKGSGSVTVDRATEKALASEFEHTWTDKGMEECRKVLEPPKSPRPRTTTPPNSGTDNSHNRSGDTSDETPPPTQNCPNGICIGRDNKGTATVNNFGIQLKRIPEDKRKELISILSPYPSSISVVATNTGNSALAQDWHDVFAASGWSVGGVGSLVLSSGQIKGVEVEFPGPYEKTVTIHPNTPAGAIRDAILLLGYTPHFSQSPTPGNVIVFIVAPDEE